MDTRAIASPSADIPVKAMGTFHYASLQTILVYWQVAPSVAASLLPHGLSPGIFDGVALVNLNFERYATVGGTFDGMVNEVEINVVAYPTASASSVFQLTRADFFAGGDQAKLYGNYRVIVPCDSAAAIKGGNGYGENKYAALFSWNGTSYSVPSVNAPGVTTWSVPCWTPTGQFLFELKVGELPGSPTPTPFSPIPDWATLTSGGTTNIVQSGRNVLGLFDVWTNPGLSGLSPLPDGLVSVTVGDVADDPVINALHTIVDADPEPIAVCRFDSAPVACSTHVLLMDPVT